MCDYCDSRRVPEIADRGTEHQTLLPGLDASALGATFDGLPRHIASKQRLLFPAPFQVREYSRWAIAVEA